VKADTLPQIFGCVSRKR